MRYFAALLALLLSVVCAATAHAASDYAEPTPASASASSSPSQTNNQQDLISFSAGYMDFDKTLPKTHSVDMRVEYRFGYTFFGGDELGFHPFLGFETNSRDLTYELGGFSMDWNFSRHGIFTWNEGIGYLDAGDQSSLGGTMQFRSQAEIGYRFDNDMRLTAQFSHISDAKTTRYNPGAEVLGIYWHIPTSVMFGAIR